MNCGVSCSGRTARARDFLDGLNLFYLRRMDHLTESLHRYGSGEAANYWMVSTWRRFGTRTSRRVLSVIVHCTMGIPNPLLTWRRRSPTIAHLVGLKPRATYEGRARSFRSQARARLG